jgi:hypothetical protein
MAFYIRNELHHVSKNWQARAEDALKSVLTITKAFNNNETLISCKKRIESVTAIGLSQKTQMHLYMALQAKRKNVFNEVVFAALRAQKDFIEELSDETK